MNCLCSRWVSFFMKQIDWFSYLPKSDRHKTNTLASCTTSLFYVNLFQRTLSLLLPQTYSSLALASDIVRSRKRMQRYSFFPYLQNFWAKNVKKICTFRAKIDISQLKTVFENSNTLIIYSWELRIGSWEFRGWEGKLIIQNSDGGCRPTQYLHF